MDGKIKYYLANPGGSLWFARDGVLFAVPREPSPPTNGPGGRTTTAHSADVPTEVVQLQPLGLQADANIEGLEQQAGRVNYLIGDDRRKWRTNIPTYGAVAYREAYPGIDLKFYGSGRELEYDVIVKPGANPGQVKFRYEGAEGLDLTPAGDLRVNLPGGGVLVQKKPIVYQEIAGQRVLREGKFTLNGDKAGCTYGFRVAAYDRRYPLIIDPTMVWSYLFASFYSRSYAIAMDAAGNSYLTGETKETLKIQEPLFEHQHAFVIKVDPSGSLIYLALIGDEKYEWRGFAIAVDAAGCVYITGNYDDNSYAFGHAFVAKLKASGDSWLYRITQLPKSYSGNVESGLGIAVDKEGCAYVTGSLGLSCSYARDCFPIGPWFVGKVKKDAPAGKEWAYFVSADMYSAGTAITLDDYGNAYVTGNIMGQDTALHVWLRGLNQNGTIIFETTWGGSGEDLALGIALDQHYNIYITGYTTSPDLPVGKNAPQPKYGGSGDAFMAKFVFPLDDIVPHLNFCTYLGGSGKDEGRGIAVSDTGIYVTGWTGSLDFPLVDSVSNNIEDSDAFVAKFNRTDSSLAYSVVLGTLSEGQGIAAHPGEAYVGGSYFNCGPPRGPFVAKFADFELVVPPYDFSHTIQIPSIWLTKLFDFSYKEAIQLEILSSGGFDAVKVNPATVTLNGGLVKVNPNGKPHFVHRDVDGDGLPDLVVWVEKASMAPVTESTPIRVYARTYDGAYLTGTIGTRPR